jgi:hypothetical protein
MKNDLYVLVEQLSNVDSTVKKIVLTETEAIQWCIDQAKLQAQKNVLVEGASTLIIPMINTDKSQIGYRVDHALFYCQKMSISLETKLKVEQKCQNIS